MRVGVVSLGLMGGSAARAYHASGHQVLACNRSPERLRQAIADGIVDSILDASNIPDCDLIILASPLDAAVDYIQQNAPYFRGVVVDFCGTKRKICHTASALAKEYGFTYFGTHPMCGTNQSGYESSLDDLYRSAPMVICPCGNSEAEVSNLKRLLAPLSLGKYIFCTPEEHDRIIALTSQMAHCITSSFVLSPTAVRTLGIKSGGFRDMTRLASLIPSMWAELMVSNRDNLLCELDGFIQNISSLRAAVASGDVSRVEEFLSRSRKAKDEIDKN